MSGRLTNPRYYFVLLAGLTAGALFSVLTLLQERSGITTPYQRQLFACLFWAGMISVFLYGVRLLRRNPTLSKTYIFIFIAMGMMLVYLFPTYLTPGCGGMPSALADCHNECTTTCSNWVPKGQKGCNPPNSWDLGCCYAYSTTCKKVCTGGPGPDSPPIIDAAITCTTPGGSGWCIANDVLKLTASDPQGYATTITGDIDGVNFSCAGPTCVKVLPEGTGTINYKVTAATSGMTDNGTIDFQYDPTNPTANLSKSGTAGSNGWYVSNVTVSVLGTDATSGLALTLVSANGGPWQATLNLSDGTYSVQGRTADNAGNQTTTSAQTIKVDKIAPTQTIAITSGTPGGSGYYVSNVTLTASASDGTSGVALTEYRVDGGTWTTGASATISTNGTHVADFRTTDNAGLISLVASQTVKVDKTPPAITFIPTGIAGSNGWYTSTLGLALSATDTTSGVSTHEYSLDGGTTWTAGNSLTLADGVSTVNLRSNDVAGNQGISSTTIKVDTIGPVVAVNRSGTNGSNSWYVSSVGLATTTSDATSGVALTEYRIDGGAWTTGTSVAVGADGNHKVDFRATDDAGNQTTSSNTFQIDQTSPISSFSQSGTSGDAGWYISTVALAINNSDLTSGVASVAYRLDGGSWTTGSSLTLMDGDHTIDSRVIDNAGNQKADTVIVKVDTVPPSAPVAIAATSGKSGWYVSDATLTVTPTDAASGVQLTEYRVDG